MERMKWTGNLTLKMDNKEDTYSPGTIHIQEYTKGAFSLEFMEPDERAVAKVRMGREEYKELIQKLLSLL